MAQAGGTEVAKLDEALEKLYSPRLLISETRRAQHFSCCTVRVTVQQLRTPQKIRSARPFVHATPAATFHRIGAV